MQTESEVNKVSAGETGKGTYGPLCFVVSLALVFAAIANVFGVWQWFSKQFELMPDVVILTTTILVSILVLCIPRYRAIGEILLFISGLCAVSYIGYHLYRLLFIAEGASEPVVDLFSGLAVIASVCVLSYCLVSSKKSVIAFFCTAIALNVAAALVILHFNYAHKIFSDFETQSEKRAALFQLVKKNVQQQAEKAKYLIQQEATEQSIALASAIKDSADVVFDTCRRHNVGCEFTADAMAAWKKAFLWEVKNSSRPGTTSQEDALESEPNDE